MFTIFPKQKRGVSKDSEMEFDNRYSRSHGGISFTDSVAIAVDFFYRALNQKLPTAQQQEIAVDLAYTLEGGWMCEHIDPYPITEDAHHERSRSVVFKQRDEACFGFRVELRQRLGEAWRVVGFEYPKEDGDENRYYVVLEPHEYFGWHAKSGPRSSV